MSASIDPTSVQSEMARRALGQSPSKPLPEATEIAILLSARNRDRMQQAVRELSQRLNREDGVDLLALSKTAPTADSGAPCRAGIVAADTDGLGQSLEELAELLGDPLRESGLLPGRVYFHAEMAASRGKIAFAYPGISSGSPALRFHAGHVTNAPRLVASHAIACELLEQWRIDRQLRSHEVVPDAVAGVRGGEILALAGSGALDPGTDFEDGLIRFERVLRSASSEAQKVLPGLFASLPIGDPKIALYDAAGRRVCDPADDPRALIVDLKTRPGDDTPLIDQMQSDGIRLVIDMTVDGEPTLPTVGASATSSIVRLSAGSRGSLRLADLRAAVFALGCSPTSQTQLERPQQSSVALALPVPEWLMDQAAMLDYLETIDLFLATQREVMEACLARASGNDPRPQRDRKL
jgi:hypothetical protein